MSLKLPVSTRSGRCLRDLIIPSACPTPLSHRRISRKLETDIRHKLAS